MTEHMLKTIEDLKEAASKFAKDTQFSIYDPRSVTLEVRADGRHEFAAWNGASHFRSGDLEEAIVAANAYDPMQAKRDEAQALRIRAAKLEQEAAELTAVK